VVKAYDPRISVSEGRAVGINVFADPYSACEMSEALVIVNDLPEFTNLDFTRMRHVMKAPFVFDTQNLLEPLKVTASGMKYIGLGRGMVR